MSAVPTASTPQPSLNKQGEEEEENGVGMVVGSNSENQPLLSESSKTGGSVDIQGGGGGLLTLWKHRWKDLIAASVLWITYFFVSAAYSIIGPFFPNEAEEKGSSPTITGLIISASPLCVVITSPLFGYYLPQLGLRFTLLSGTFLVGGAFVLIGFLASMPSGWIFITFCILLRSAEGVGAAMFITAAFTLLPQMFPSRVGFLMGLMEVGGGLGFAIGPPIGGVLYGIGGFELPFFVVGGICILFIGPLYFIKYSSCTKQVLHPLVVLKVLGNFLNILLVSVNILSLAALGFFTPTLQPFLTDEFNLSVEHVGLVFLGGPVTYMLCAFFAGRLSDKLGPRYLIIVGFFVTGIGFFTIGPADFISRPALWVTIGSLCVIGFGAALGIVPCFSDMLNVSKSMNITDDTEALTAIISGITSSSLSLGEFVGPIVGGALTQVLDFQTSAVVFGELLIAEAFLLLGATTIDRCARKRQLIGFKQTLHQ